MKSKRPTGEFHRLLLKGDYQVTFKAEGYLEKTIEVKIREGNKNINRVIELERLRIRK